MSLIGIMSVAHLLKKHRRPSTAQRVCAAHPCLSAVRLALICSGLALGMAGCHSTASLTPQQAEGKQLYQVRCAHCHQYNDMALEKIPPDLHGLFSRQALPSGAPATDDAVRHTVLAGRGMMPAFSGRFSDGQMAALLSYLHTDLR